MTPRPEMRSVNWSAGSWGNLEPKPD